MSKKILTFGVAMIFVFLLMGCDTSSTTTTTTATSTSSETTTTTSTTTTSTTTTSMTDTTQSTTTTTGTSTSLIDLIPEDCADLSIEDGWVPVWCDEFNYTGGIDTTKWSYQIGGGGFGNNELQYYTNRTDNLYVDGEFLNIIAKKESYSTNGYTSAKIWTQNTESWKYGKFEMRAKLPAGRGTWPAFWMMPLASKYGGWPDSGEIDIMEHVGYDMNVVHGTIHTDRFYGTNGRGGSATILVNQGLVPPIHVDTEFHTYGIVWDETSITWYFDGFPYATEEYDPYLSLSVLYDTSVDWPFDQKFYLILNLAIGGTWGGAQGVDDSIFPVSLIVDYVRVYQQDYVTGDTQAPDHPTSPTIIYGTTDTAYLIWTESFDDKNIARYEVWVNGNLVKKTSVPGVRLTALRTDYDNIVWIFAEDYAGNLSDPLELVITK